MKKTTLRQAAMKLALVAFALLAPLGLSAQTIITIGEGTSAQKYPLPGYYWYQYDVFLYTPAAAAALDADCDISSIAFNVKTNNSSGESTMQIWVKDVDADYALAGTTTFSEYTEGATLVYENDDLVTTTGWNTFDFSSTFSHEGGKALLVAVRGEGCGTSSCARECYYTSATGTYWYKHQDETDPGTSTTGSISSNNRANIQLAITYTGSVCLTPSGLGASGVTHEAATLSWTENGTETGWVLQYGTDNTFASNTEVHVSTTPSHDISGLSPTTPYYARVKPDCDNDDSHWSTTASFSTTAVAEAVGDSWSDDFEGVSCGWELVNGTLTNANWAWGTAASNGGTHALYISNDNGITNDYNASGYAKVYAIKLLSFNASKYKFHFDWKCVGETSYDYLSVGLVPASTQLTADNTSASSLPTGWIALHDAANLSAQATWQTSPEKTIQLEAGSYYLVFRWRQDSGTKDGVPAAVDNVSITKVACPYDVEDLEVADDPAVTTTTATINWTAGEATQWQVMWSTESNFPEGENTHTEIVNAATKALTGLTASTNYYVKVRAYCGGTDYGEWCDPINFPTACEAITIDGEHPYTENFDNYVTGNNALPLCWSYINTTTNVTYKYYPKIYNYNSNSQPNQLQLHSYAYYGSGGTTTSDPKPQYAILPEMNDLSGLRMKLYARANSTGSSYDATFHVGIMSDPTDASTFDEIGSGYTPASTTYELFTIPFNSYIGSGKYIAIMIEAAEGSGTYASFYKSVYIDDITVEPIPSCTEPSALQFVSSTTNTATIQWTAGGSEPSWDIYYSTENVAPTGSTAPLANVTTNPATISGLAASTTYFVWVRAHCDDGDGQQSPWIGGIEFNTECAAFTVDAEHHYTDNFDSYTATGTGTSPSSSDAYTNWDKPLCWKFLNRSASTSTYPQAFLSSSSDYAVSGNCLFFKSSSSTPLYAILPEFSNNVSDLMLTFTYRNEGTGSSNGTLYVSYMTDPTDASTFNTANAIECDQITTKTEMEVFFPNAPAGSYIAFKYQGGSSNNFYLSIDNVEVQPAPTCRKPSNLAKSGTTAHTATLSWTNGAIDQDAWQIAYSTSPSFAPANNFTPGEGEGLADVTTNPATIDGLAQSSTYYAYVRANCGGGDYSDWCNDKVTFATIAGNVTPTGLAVNEASSNSATATWSAVAGNERHQSYDIYWDLASVEEVPAEPTAPNLIAGITGTSQEISGLNPTIDYKVWVRDNCGTDGYSDWSAAVPFSTLAACPNPQNLAVGTVIANEATVTWTTHAENDSYNLMYRKATTAPVNINETYDFESDGMQGWTTISNDNDANAWTRVSGDAHEGSYCVRSRYTNSGDGEANDWLISPQIPLGGTFSFYAKRYSTSYTDQFQVYVSTTGNNVSDFTAISEVITPTASYLLYEYDLSAYSGNGYVAIVYTAPNNQYYVYVDDINYTYNVPGVFEGWQTVNNATSPQTITGLDPESYYEAKVYGVCDDNQEATGSNTVNFTTLPSCLAPTALTVNGYANTYVDLSWTRNSDEETSWQLCFNGDEEHLVNVTSGYTVNGSVISYLTPENTLDPATAYTVKVRTYCSNTDQSAWSNVESFTTLVACPVPTGLDATNMTTTSADLSWTPGLNETEWTIYYKTTSEAEYHEVAGVTENPYTLNGLTHSSNYVFYVKANCSAVEESDPSSTFNFQTECEAVTVFPWTENFNGLTEANSIPVCWNNDEGTTTTAGYKWCYTTGTSGNGACNGTSHDDSKCVRFESFNNSENNDNFLKTAPLSLPSEPNMQLKFWYKNPAGGDFSVYISTDGGITYTTALVTGLTNQSTWTEIAPISLEDYAGQDVVIVFKGVSSWGYGDAYIYLDDVTVEEIPVTRTLNVEANKWYAIASPVHNSGDNETLEGVTNLTSDTYDLYGYTESTGTWDKPTTTLDLGKGYIYRRSTAATLSFVGYINEGNKEVAITSQCADANIAGLNLVGNPFPHAISRTDYYTLQPNGLWLAHDAGNIGEAEAFLVYTSLPSTDYEINDVTPSKKSAPAASPAITFTVSNGEFRDVAYARFDGSAVLPKIGHLEPNAPALSIPVDGKKYAIANLGSDCESFDMVFSGIGDYTISASGDATYLHLIDKVTGKDIDLLSQPYTFKAGIGDITSRFIVKLVPDGETVSAGNFAFRNGNGWTIEGDGTLEAYDALGRRIFAQEISSSNYQLSKASFPAAGVYVLRMGGNSQKIVVTE